MSTLQEREFNYLHYQTSNYSQRLKNLKGTIKEYQEKEGLILCPDFQRGHVWTKKQQIDFCEFTLRGGQTHKPIIFNSAGWSKGQEGSLVCVDGLQRLTALIRMLDGDLKVFGKKVHDFSDSVSTLSTRSLDFVIFGLSTREEILNLYLDINATGKSHSKAELDKVRTLLVDKRIRMI